MILDQISDSQRSVWNNRGGILKIVFADFCFMVS